jgi:hypothetical protein
MLEVLGPERFVFIVKRTFNVPQFQIFTSFFPVAATGA